VKAFITGGAGFIGSHLTDLLLDLGWHVVVLDDFSTGSIENLAAARTGPNAARLEVVTGSITDAAAVARLCDGADVVFHLAAAVGVFTIQSKTLDSLRTNVHGTEVVLEAVRTSGSRLLVASTSEVYGKNTAIGLTEEANRIIGSPLKSRWSYAEAKAIDETLTHQYSLHHDVLAVIVRLFNTSGPRQSGRYGMVLPRFVRQALAGDPLTVFGDGAQTRCFAHVADVVPALVRLVDNPASFGDVFNIGNPEQVSIAELADRVIGRVGSTSEVEYVSYEDAYGPGYEDMQRRVPDCTKISALIGFRVEHTLDDVIDTIVDHEAGRSPELSMAIGSPG
jgi:UDP-glucose 4-epimerase